MRNCDYKLIPHETVKDASGPAGSGYVVCRAEDGHLLAWDSLHLTDPLESFPVVGVKYRLDALQDPAFSPASLLQLVREPDNPYDSNAIAVWDAERKLHIGFAPRERAPKIAAALDRGENLTCMAIWEVIEEGRRVALRVLLIQEGIRVAIKR